LRLFRIGRERLVSNARTCALVRAGILFAASLHLTAGCPARKSLSVGRVILYENSDESSRTVPPLSQDVLEYGHSAKQAVSSGQLLTAIEVARDGLARFGSDRLLQQQLALALAQTGALDAARETLGELPGARGRERRGDAQPARPGAQELWRRTDDPTKGTEALEQSCKFYGDAFALKESYYPASISRSRSLRSASSRKRARARKKVEKYCRIEMGQTLEKPDGWLIATLAEALTHQGSTAEAAKYYRQAVENFPAGARPGVDAAAGRMRSSGSTRRSARTRGTTGMMSRRSSSGVREALGRSEQGYEWLDQCFGFPSIVVFFRPHDRSERPRAGAVFDGARGRGARRDPRALETINRFRLFVGGVGADIIFCECNARAGGQG